MKQLFHLLAYLVMASCSAQSQTRLVFSDDFNRSTIGSNWSIRYGTWSIENNMLKHVGDGSFDPNFILYANPISYSPPYQLIVQCKMQWASGGFLEDGVSVFHRPLNASLPGYQGRHDEYYLACLSNYAGNEARLYRERVFQNQLFDHNTSYPRVDSLVRTGTWFNLKVVITKATEVRGAIEFYVNNKLFVWEAGHLDSLLGNRVGLGSWKGQYRQVVYFDDFRIDSGGVTSVADGRTGTPEHVSLLQNYPNPFNPTTTIEYQLEGRGNVQINIYNSLGQLVRSLVNEQREAGMHSDVWDGKDNIGIAVATGAYFYQVQVGEFVQAKRMLLLK
jgi:hypothetical protein